MKTGINWRKFTRESKNGVTTEATYHGKYVHSFFLGGGILFLFFSCLVGSILNLFSIEVNRMKLNMYSQPGNHFMDQLNTIKVI